MPTERTVRGVPADRDATVRHLCRLVPADTDRVRVER
jgi:hypothetical protein